MGLVTAPAGGPVQASWDNHFAAFGGLAGVKELFTGLFKDLHDTSGLAAPAIRVEEASEGIAGSVFLVWRCPTSGFTHVTDTFLFDEDGKIAKQNIACIKAAGEQ